MSTWAEEIYFGEEYLKNYFLALPNLLENSLGVYNRKAVLNRLKVAVPGETPTVMWVSYGSFHDLFFKDSTPLPDQDELDKRTNISNETWSNNSIPFVCDTIYNVTTDTRQSVDIQKVSQDKKTIPQLMGNRHVYFYQYLLTMQDNPIAAAWSALSDDEKKTGKDSYIQALTNPTWVYNKVIAQQTGNWPDPDWELFHHWCKLQILGASEDEISCVMKTLTDKGLFIPETVTMGKWLQYDRWVSEPNFTWNDFSEAREAMNQQGVIGQYLVNELFSRYFLEGPGDAYWKQPPEPSCFGPETWIKMADGTLKPIAAICQGDVVASPQGPRKVLFVSMSLRGKRDLYSLKGHSFRFSASHPFVLKGGYGCVSPELLRWLIPTFEQESVVNLSKDTILLTPSGKAVPIDEIQCHAFTPGCEKEILYDVIPELAGGTAFQYYAGDESEQYLVSSEIPGISGREQLARIFLTIFHQIGLPLLDVTASIQDTNLWKILQSRLARYVQFILPGRFAACSAESSVGRSHQSVASISPDLHLILSAYTDQFEDKRENIRLGLLFSAAFTTLLPFLMQKNFSLEEADILAAIIKADIQSGILFYGLDC